MDSNNTPQGTTASALMTRSQYARAFGGCALAYERARSGYPQSLFRDIWRFAGRSGVQFVLEVGAGSGKATVQIADAGARMDCLEPSRNMSRILRMKVSAFPNVRVWTTSFERWRPHRRYCLLVAAQSWHLIDPETRLAKAAAVLRPGGTLALFWNQPPQPASETAQRALYSALGQSGLDLSWPPSRMVPAGDSACEPRGLPPLYSSPDFAVAGPRSYWTAYRLSLSSYLGILHTYPEYLALSVAERQRLDVRIGSAVFGHGSLDAGHRTVLQLARRTGPS
jgi:SAM-dependent methyltransferase